MKDLRNIPVLKLPAELLTAVMAVLYKNENRLLNEKQQALRALRPAIGVRTLINAYTIPSLHELNLYDGTLAAGGLTRFGREIAISTISDQKITVELVAKQLLSVDEDRVGIVKALIDSANKGSMSRAQVAKWFILQSVHSQANEQSHHLDRLGKWIAYLLYFNVLRDESGKITFDQRHIQALSTEASPTLSDEEVRVLVLDSYLRASSRLGTKYYIPIGLLKDMIGDTLSKQGVVLTDGAIDNVVLRSIPLLSGETHTVNFSPFSGPARYGLKLPNMFAGFITIRPK